jgi:hypothetical protein
MRSLPAKVNVALTGERRIENSDNTGISDDERFVAGPPILFGLFGRGENFKKNRPSH